MRILSETASKGRVVELTADEWREFQELAAAIEGDRTLRELYWDFRVQDRSGLTTDAEVDFKSVFGNIQAFYLAKFRLSEMQRAVDMFKKSVEGGKE